MSLSLLASLFTAHFWLCHCILWGVRRKYSLERASRRWQICKFMLWLADRRGNKTKQTNFAPKHAQSRRGASEVALLASRMHQVKVKNFRRATRKSVLKSIKKFSVCIRWRFMSISHPIWTAPNAALLTPTNCVPVMFASSESCESFV